MKILYATDGSAPALAAATLLAALPLDRDSSITLLAVEERGDSEAAAEALAAASRALAGSPARTETRTRGGHPAEEILREAEEHGYDVIALGSTGRSGIARFLVGSVAERVARNAPCPVLVVRPEHTALRSVILGIDGSDASLEAARWLQRFPLPPECEVRLFTALPLYPVGIGMPSAALPTYLEILRQINQQARRDAQQRLEALAESFHRLGRRVAFELRECDPAEGLLRVAAERQADLIVVGSQGLSAVERFLMGSVSEKVLRHAPCSVLVVRRRAAE